MNLEQDYWPNGRIKFMKYRNDNGYRHNANGPAYQEWYECGQIAYESYYIDGWRHNDKRPAIRKWNRFGQIVEESYYVNGRLHNANGPAYRCWYGCGQICRKKYFIDYVTHNIDGPSVRGWSKSGYIDCEYYHIDGRKHNANGPAVLEWFAGKIQKEYYYLYGNAMDDEDQWRDLTKPPEILQVISLLPYPIAVEVDHHYCKA